MLGIKIAFAHWHSNSVTLHEQWQQYKRTYVGHSFQQTKHTTFANSIIYFWIDFHTTCSFKKFFYGHLLPKSFISFFALLFNQTYKICRKIVVLERLRNHFKWIVKVESPIPLRYTFFKLNCRKMIRFLKKWIVCSRREKKYCLKTNMYNVKRFILQQIDLH